MHRTILVLQQVVIVVHFAHLLLLSQLHILLDRGVGFAVDLTIDVLIFFRVVDGLQEVV